MTGWKQRPLSRSPLAAQMLFQINEGLGRSSLDGSNGGSNSFGVRRQQQQLTQQEMEQYYQLKIQEIQLKETIRKKKEELILMEQELTSVSNRIKKMNTGLDPVEEANKPSFKHIVAEQQ